MLVVFIFLPEKHTLWEHFRTASPSRFERKPTIYVFEQKKINVYPCKPQIYCMNVGFKGVKTI